VSACLTCRSELDLPRWIYIRHDGGPNILHANVKGTPPLEPTPCATRYGPYCPKCVDLELARLLRPTIAPRAGLAD
jgi:hypothetical protein